MSQDSSSARLRILTPQWHSPYNVISAGGFRRTYEIFKRAPDNVEICTLDNAPSFLTGATGPNVQVIEYSIPRFVKKLEKRFFIIERLAEWFFSFVYMAAWCVRSRLGGRCFDLVVVPSSEIFPSLTAGLVAKVAFGCPLVLCNMNIELYPRPVMRLLAILHNFADRVITLSRDLEDKLRYYGVRAPIVINGAGLDSDYISALLAGHTVEKEYDAVFVGRHVDKKGIFDLIEIWKLLDEIRPGVRLLTIGSCDPVNRSLIRRLIDKHGLRDSIVVKGPVAEDEKILLIKASKVCLFPSPVEGWGIVPQEALACGLPVVVYDLPVYAETILDCDAVFSAPPGDWKRMADLTADLLRDDRYLRYENVGPEFVRRFDWDTVAEHEFSVITSVGLSGTERYTSPTLVTRVTRAVPDSVKQAVASAAMSRNARERRSDTFVFRGERFKYLFHPYNLAWRNERTVEIPVMQEMIRVAKGEVLEVGNVLSHYLEAGHDVIDKYERAEGMINEDAEVFTTDKKYSLIVSVSTLEHVGWDEYPRDPGKILRVIDNLRDLLEPGGVLVATAPVGLNPDFDRLVEQRVIPFAEIRAMKRCSTKNDWEEVHYNCVKGSGYDRSLYRARAIVILFIGGAG